jgi:hypothetical protein
LEDEWRNCRGERGPATATWRFAVEDLGDGIVPAPHAQRDVRADVVAVGREALGGVAGFQVAVDEELAARVLYDFLVLQAHGVERQGNLALALGELLGVKDGSAGR